MEVKIKKLYNDSTLPTKAHATDAGYDLYAANKNSDRFGNIVFGTGVAVEIPKGYVGLVFPRSSIANRDLLLSNSVGVIDSGYRGEIMLKFKPIGSFSYDIGERIGQIIIMPYPEIEFVEVEELSYSERGNGSYGITVK